MLKFFNYIIIILLFFFNITFAEVVNVFKFTEDELSKLKVRKIRGSGIGMIFQEPMTALNPVLSIGKQMTEALVINGVCSQNEANERAIEMLDRVSITEPKKRMKQFPHEFSGGMRQRMLIAMVMLMNNLTGTNQFRYDLSREDPKGFKDYENQDSVDDVPPDQDLRFT